MSVSNLAFAFLLASASASASAQPPATHPCASVSAPAERLACYDKAFPRLVDDETLQAERTAHFGLTRGELRQRGGLIEPETQERIEATVVRVSGEGSGRLVTLDNGQVWQQIEASLLGSLDPGDKIRLKRGSFGTFLLVTKGRVSLRVRRVR